MSPGRPFSKRLCKATRLYEVQLRLSMWFSNQRDWSSPLIVEHEVPDAYPATQALVRLGWDGKL